VAVEHAWGDAQAQEGHAREHPFRLGVVLERNGAGPHALNLVAAAG
jgi:hypothetical protein